MAQFLTYDGKVVAEQEGRGDYIRVRFRGQKDFVSVSATEWKTKKQFEYFDASRVKREKALDTYEAARKQRLHH